ncbi:MAG TPA: hypothetical protein PLK42_07895 [Casimicrobium sp.]|nr:hypothetical protein [Casimicrobium sp.]
MTQNNINPLTIGVAKRYNVGREGVSTLLTGSKTRILVRETRHDASHKNKHDQVVQGVSI